MRVLFFFIHLERISKNLRKEFEKKTQKSVIFSGCVIQRMAISISVLDPCLVRVTESRVMRHNRKIAVSPAFEESCVPLSESKIVVRYSWFL